MAASMRSVQEFNFSVVWPSSDLYLFYYEHHITTILFVLFMVILFVDLYIFIYNILTYIL